MKLRKFWPDRMAAEGYRLPRFYGFYRRDYETRGYWLLPVPFNRIARVWVSFYDWLRMPTRSRVEKHFDALLNHETDVAWRRGVEHQKRNQEFEKEVLQILTGQKETWEKKQ